MSEGVRERCGGWIWGSFGGSVSPTSRSDVLLTGAARCGKASLCSVALPAPQSNQESKKLVASVEILGCGLSEAGENIFKMMPPLACGPIYIDHAAVVIDESESDRGQVLLIGRLDDEGESSAVRKVDLATGVCTTQPSLLCPQGLFLGHLVGKYCIAGGLPDGRIVCVGTTRVRGYHPQ